MRTHRIAHRESAASPRAPTSLRETGAGAARLIFTAVQIALFGLFPLALAVFQIESLVRGHSVAVDFREGPLIAGHALFSGHTPYVGAHSPSLQGIAFVYPAVAAYVLAPFSLLPHNVADGTFTLVNLLAVLLTLRALDVRDWRLYGVVTLWPSVLAGWETGNITLLLGLGVALAWRYRERPAVSGVLLALVISMKVFLWPLIVWLVATRRWRACGWTLAAGLAMNLAAWSALGLGQLSRYMQLLGALSRNQQTRGYSLIALVMNSGGSHALARAVMVAAATALIAGCLVAGRRNAGRPALALAIAAAIAGSPISWLHYFALLVVPLAIARPRLSAIWIVPLLFQYPTIGPTPGEIAVTLGVMAMMLLVVGIRDERVPRLVRLLSGLEAHPGPAPARAKDTGTRLTPRALTGPAAP